MTRYLYAGAVGAIGIGIALVYAGVLAGGAFVPGTILVGIGIAAAAVAGLIDVFAPRPTVD